PFCFKARPRCPIDNPLVFQAPNRDWHRTQGCAVFMKPSRGSCSTQQSTDGQFAGKKIPVSATRLLWAFSPAFSLSWEFVVPGVRRSSLSPLVPFLFAHCGP